MNEEQFQQMRAHFPWREVVHPNGVIQMLDRNGTVVPLLTIVAFSKFITAKLVKEASNATKEQS